MYQIQRDEMAAIGKQLEQDIAESVAEQEAKIARMEGQIEAQTKIRDEERADLSKLRAENIELHTKYEHLLTDHGVEEKEIRELDEKIAETNNESATEARKKDDFEEVNPLFFAVL
jgi:chromosome segregation ATPase